jgi:outer membrane protein TolC
MVLMITALLSGCASSSTKNNIDSNKANTDHAVLSTKSKKSTPEITSLRLDTKLNIQFDWWKILQSTQLNMLIDQLFDANPTDEDAQSVLLKLQQNEISREGYFYSSIIVSDGEKDQVHHLNVQDIPKTDEAKFIGEAYYDIHDWQFSVGYLPEMLRSNQKIATTKTEIDLHNLQMEAAYRTLADNFIACEIQEASLRAQMTAVRKIVAIEQNFLTSVQKRIKAGLEIPTEVVTREQSLEFSLQALQRLKDQFEQIRGAERIMLNVSADKDLPESIELAKLKLLETLPLELSASVIEQRPDVRAALMEMLPANTKYQTTADFALKNVESTLNAIHNDAISLKAADASQQQNMELLNATRNQYKTNLAKYQDVLLAEQGFQFATLRAAQERAKQLGNAVMLYHALGGSWWAMNEAVKLELDSDLNHKTPSY